MNEGAAHRARSPGATDCIPLPQSGNTRPGSEPRWFGARGRYSVTTPLRGQHRGLALASGQGLGLWLRGRVWVQVCVQVCVQVWVGPRSPQRLPAVRLQTGVLRGGSSQSPGDAVPMWRCFSPAPGLCGEQTEEALLGPQSSRAWRP